MKQDNIKRSWKDITIKDYQDIVQISKRELATELEKDIAVAAVLYGKSEKEMYDLDVTTLKRMLGEMAWIKQPFKFNTRWHLKTLVINGKKCRMYQSVEELSVAQYMDFQNYWEKREENMGAVLACFIVPEGCKYNEGYDVVQFAQELERTLSIEEWNAIAFFLLRNWLHSIRASIRYSAWEMTKAIWKEKDKTRKTQMKGIRRELMERLKYIRLCA